MVDGLQEMVLSAYNFAIEGVDDGVGLAEEPIDPTNLLKIVLPLRGMLDDNSKVNIFIFGLDPPGYLLALNQTILTYAVSILSAEPAIM